MLFSFRTFKTKLVSLLSLLHVETGELHLSLPSLGTCPLKLKTRAKLEPPSGVSYDVIWESWVGIPWNEFIIKWHIIVKVETWMETSLELRSISANNTWWFTTLMSALHAWENPPKCRQNQLGSIATAISESHKDFMRRLVLYQKLESYLAGLSSLFHVWLSLV